MVVSCFNTNFGVKIFLSTFQSINEIKYALKIFKIAFKKYNSHKRDYENLTSVVVVVVMVRV